MQLSASGQPTPAHSTTMTFARHEDGDVTTLAVLVVEHERPMPMIEVNSELVSAITEWVANAASGKVAWQESCHDFNIGDLCEHMEDTDLARYLHARGMLIRSLETVDVGPAQPYDRLLVDTDNLS